MKKLILIAVILSLSISSVSADVLPQDIFEGDPAYEELQLCLQDPPENTSLICYEGFMKNVESVNTDEEIDFFLQNVCDGPWDYNRVCMTTFGQKVANIPDVINYCETVEEISRGDYCKIFTVFYRDNFSDTDLEELANVCSDTTKLSDESMESCYGSFASKCGSKSDESSVICIEKMPIFYYFPYSNAFHSLNIYGYANYGYGVFQPNNIDFCIERRSSACIKDLFLTLNEDEMRSSCDNTKGSDFETICSSLMEKRIAQIKLEEEKEASLQAREINEDICTERMLNDLKNLFIDQEIEEFLKEQLMFRCSSYAFWAEQLSVQFNVEEEDQTLQVFLEAWRQYMFLNTVHKSEMNRTFIEIFNKNTKERLEELKEKVKGFKVALESAKAEVDGALITLKGGGEIATSFVSDEHKRFMDEADDYIENVDRSLYFQFNECPNNICELVEAEKAFKEEQSEPVFDDVDKFNTKAIPIRYLKNNNIVGGYPDGTFKPDKTINRAELLKIVVESQFDESAIEACIAENSEPGWGHMFFSDVPIDEWYTKYVCMGKVHEIIKGYPDGTFQPGRAVNRVESVKIVMEALDFNVDDVEFSIKPYGDTPTDQWFTPYIHQGKQMAIFSNTGYTFNPGEEMNRGDVSEILYRLLVLSKLKEGKYHQELDIKMFQLSNGN